MFVLLASAAPGYFCAVSPIFHYNQYSDASVRLYDYWGGAPAWEYVTGNNADFKESGQFCSFRKGKMICSDGVPNKDALDIQNIQKMSGASCGCIGYKFCMDGTGTGSI